MAARVKIFFFASFSYFGNGKTAWEHSLKFSNSEDSAPVKKRLMKPPSCLHETLQKRDILFLLKACNFTKSNIPPWVFSRFLNCKNDTKSCNTSHIFYIMLYPLIMSAKKSFEKSAHTITYEILWNNCCIMRKLKEKLNLVLKFCPW